VFADATTRFSKRVQSYVRFRPGYPPELVDLLKRECALPLRGVVADVGSGTGLLSRAFLDAGYAVTGVEPNREMREAGDALLGGNPRFRSINGQAEATTLPDHSVDLIVAGQAFHWFNVEPTRREWVRILRPGGFVALVWNERFIESPFMREVESVIDMFAREMDKDGVIREAGRSRIAGFFAPFPYRLDEFPNQQRFDLTGLLGRIVSCSYVPPEGAPGYDEMARQLSWVFDRWQEDGQVTFEYRTKVYWGRITED
jgi:SAM-dependent methyltransferase